MGSGIEEFLDRLEGVRATGERKWTARCPAHDDQRASLSISIGKNGAILLRCHAGCTAEQVTTRLGMGMRDLYPPRDGHAGRSQRRLVSTYGYYDTEGVLVYEVCRYEPKDFRQRRPGAGGQWEWSLNGTPRILYRLPELNEADHAQPVYVVEGEKDVDNLLALGLVATCNVAGAGKWRDEYSETLRGRHIVILPDNDAPGAQHAEAVARSLIGKAASVRVLRLPGLPPKGDVSDWLKAGGTTERLAALTEAAPKWCEPNQVDQALTLPARPSDDERPPETDLGNADRFVRMHGATARYVPAWRKWLIYDGKRWRRDEREQVWELAKRTVRSIRREAADVGDGSQRERLWKWARESESVTRIQAMLKAAQSSLAVTPHELDADAYLFNCQNGTLNLRTASLQPHRREDFITKISPVAYDPAAECPTFRAFVDRIFRGHPNLVTFQQRFAGYCLTGAVSDHVLPFWFGQGANGKTTLAELWMHVYGDYAGKADRELLMARDGADHPTNVAMLMGLRFIVCSESNEGRRFDEAKVKDLTGELHLTARYMRGDFFTFVRTFKLVLASNHKPTVRATDHGFWRRIRLVPFAETITDDERDPHLLEKLKAEAPGVLRWMADGCAAWQREGLGLPSEVKNATDSYRGEMDLLGNFIAERCTLGPTASASAGDLLNAYNAWRQAVGERAVSSRRLASGLAEKGLKNVRDSRTGRVLWRGISLQSFSGVNPKCNNELGGGAPETAEESEAKPGINEDLHSVRSVIPGLASEPSEPSETEVLEALFGAGK